jgi:hypothetical protein
MRALRPRSCVRVRQGLLLSLLPAVAAAALLCTPPAAADPRAQLTRQMDQHMCRMNKMYRECLERNSEVGRPVDRGSETFPSSGSALSATARQQCEMIPAQIQRYHAECLAATAHDPDYALDCEVFLRTQWPAGAC